MTHPDQPDEPVSSTSQTRPNRWKKWGIVLISLILVVGIFILLLPTLVGTRPIRSLIIGQVNEQLNGRIEIDQVNIGWISPIRLAGVRLYDRENRLVIEVPKLETEASLGSLIRGNLDFGHTTVVADAAYVVIRQDGSSNIHDILRFGLAPKNEPSRPKSHEKTSSEMQIPGVRADITLDLKGQIQLVDSQGQNLTRIHILPQTGGTFQLDPLKQGIRSDLQLIYSVDQAPRSRILIQGVVDPLAKGPFDLKQLTANAQLSLEQVDVSAIKPLLILAGIKDAEIKGILNGKIRADLKKGESGSIAGQPVLSEISFIAPGLLDRYQAREITFPIEIRRTVTGENAFLEIQCGMITPQLKASLWGQLPESFIKHRTTSELNGQAGQLTARIEVDVPALARALPHTLRLREDTRIESGTILTELSASMTARQGVQSSFQTDLGLSGIQNGQPFQIPPIKVRASGTCNNLTQPLKGLIDLSATISSSFASLELSAPSLARLNGNGQIHLKQLREQLSQLMDLSGVQLDGSAEISLTNEEVAEDSYRAGLQLRIGNLETTLPDKAPVRIGHATINVQGDYRLDPGQQRLTKVESASVSCRIGDTPQSTIMDADARVRGLDLTALTVNQFEIKPASVISLPRLWQMLDPWVPGLKSSALAIQNGAFYLSTQGSADLKNGVVMLENLECSAPALRATLQGKPLLDEKRVYLSISGQVRAGPERSVELSRILFDSSVATLSSTDRPLVVRWEKGLPMGQGQVKTTVQLPALNRIAQAFSAQKIPTIQNGQFIGELSFANQASGSEPTVQLEGQLNGLTIDQTPVQNETVRMELRSVMKTKSDQASVTANIKGSFLSLNLKDTMVNLAAGTSFINRLESALLVVGIPDLQKAALVVQAVVPGLSLPYLPSGGLAADVSIKNQSMNLNLQASQVGLTDVVSDKTYRFDRKRPLTLSAGLSFVHGDRIEKLELTRLEGDLDVIRLAMPTPVVIDDLSHNPRPQGQLRLTGSLERLASLVQFLRRTDQPLPYRGEFDLTPTIRSEGTRITLAPVGKIQNLVIQNSDGQPVFTEKQMRLSGELMVDVVERQIDIRSLDLDTTSSQSAKLQITGGIRGWSGPEVRFNNLSVQANAVGEKIWPMIFPLLSSELQTKLAKAGISGPVRLDILVDGAYDLGAGDFHRGVQPLRVRGTFGVEKLDLTDAYGLTIAGLTQWFSIDAGRLVTGHKSSDGQWQFAPPFQINGGKGDLGSIVIVLSHPDLPVSIGRKQRLLTSVQLNRVMAAQLGSLASVIFKDSRSASGIVDVVVMDCTDVPLFDLIQGSQKARADILYSIRDLRLDGPVPGTLAGILGWGDQGIVGKIENGSLVLKDGVAYQNMTLDLLKVVSVRDERTGQQRQQEQWQQLMFKGGIDLEKQKFRDYSLWISSGLLLQDWRKSFPNGATVQLRGDVSDVGSILTQTIGSLAVQGYGGSLIDDLLNKKKK